MAEQLVPFAHDPDSRHPLSDAHIAMVSSAGASAPYRNWGFKWPYFVSDVVGRWEGQEVADCRCRVKVVYRLARPDRHIGRRSHRQQLILGDSAGRHWMSAESYDAAQDA